MKLSEYLHDYRPGAGPVRRIAWYVCNALLFRSWLLPFSAPKRAILRWFGAHIGPGVVVKPRVNVKYPWRLSVGAHTWIGEGVWIDNLDDVHIGSNVCISQGSYLLTGNHDYRSERFSLQTAPIVIEDQAWIGAFCVVCPGVVVQTGSVLSVGSVLLKSTEARWVYRGNPAERLRPRYRPGAVYPLAEAKGDAPCDRAASTEPRRIRAWRA